MMKNYIFGEPCEETRSGSRPVRRQWTQFNYPPPPPFLASRLIKSNSGPADTASGSGDGSEKEEEEQYNFPMGEEFKKYRPKHGVKLEDIPRYEGKIPPGWTKPLCTFTRPHISSQDWARYKEQVKASGGYDVDKIPGMESWGLITPVANFEDGQYEEYDIWKKSALFAIDSYNQGKEEGEKLELLKLLKVNLECCCCAPREFITFEAKDKTANDNIRIYQARIDIIPPRKMLREFREKQSLQI